MLVYDTDVSKHLNTTTTTTNITAKDASKHCQSPHIFAFNYNCAEPDAQKPHLSTPTYARIQTRSQADEYSLLQTQNTWECIDTNARKQDYVSRQYISCWLTWWPREASGIARRRVVSRAQITTTILDQWSAGHVAGRHRPRATSRISDHILQATTWTIHNIYH